MRRHGEEQAVLYELFPSRWDDDPVTRARTVLAGLAGVHGFALEFAASEAGLRFYLRARCYGIAESVLGQVRAAYPQADFEPVSAHQHPHLDPLTVASHEGSATFELALSRDSAFPLDTDVRHGEPLAGVFAAGVSAGSGDTRVVGQVLVGRSPRPSWATSIQRRAERSALARLSHRAEPNTASLLPLVAVAGTGALGLQSYSWYQSGQSLPLLAIGGIAMVGLPIGAYVWSRYVSGHEPIASALAEQKLAFPAFHASLRLTAIGPPHQVEDVGRRVAAAYEAFDQASGNSLRPRRSKRSSLTGTPRKAQFARPVILNAAELAALWHLPEASSGLPVAAKPSGRRFLPADDAIARGGRVGISRHHGQSVPVHLPHGALYRNHLVVAKTRRGKSTLLQHIAAHLMQQIASGRERLLLVVIDPHQDLAESVISVVPPALENRTAYLDLTDRRRPAGLNLLDVALFPNRDRATENIVAMLHRLWPDNWGPRMEGALRAALLCLHQANQVRRREEQYTRDECADR